jgi:hypothetical protein
MQMALGAVYSWSVFRIPLRQTYGWTVSHVTVAFELAIFVLGFAAFAGGIWMRQTGPRWVAISAAVLYGLGTASAGISQFRGRSNPRRRANWPTSSGGLLLDGPERIRVGVRIPLGGFVKALKVLLDQYLHD